MKAVAITQRLVRNETYPEVRDALDVRWAQLAEAAGFILLPLPSCADFGQYAETITFAGIIFSGGNDLSRFSPDELSVSRDRFEKGLLDYAVQTRTPVLGICRGMQMIADYFGAELGAVPGHVGQKHHVNFAEETRYWEPRLNPAEVNSYHSYGVTALPAVLRECARATDGLIEAFEHVDLSIVAQMWHPEREAALNRHDVAMIRKLFNIGEYGR